MMASAGVVQQMEPKLEHLSGEFVIPEYQHEGKRKVAYKSCR